jgi:hypothetical protein
LRLLLRSQVGPFPVKITALVLLTAILGSSSEHMTSTNATNSMDNAGDDSFDPSTVRNKDTRRLLAIVLECYGATSKIGNALVDL